MQAGKFVATHGIHGELRLECWCDGPEFLMGIGHLHIGGLSYAVESAKEHKHLLIVKLRGVDDVNAAMLFKGKIAFFDREEAPLPEGRYFIQDLLGLSVIDDESGARLGKLADVLMMPAGQVYVVRGEKEYMIPAVPEFVREIDMKEGVIRVRLIEGMETDAH